MSVKIRSFFSSSVQYLIGSENRIEVEVNVTNSGEDAYEAMLFIQFPKHIKYTKTELLWSNIRYNYTTRLSKNVFSKNSFCCFK